MANIDKYLYLNDIVDEYYWSIYDPLVSVPSFTAIKDATFKLLCSIAYESERGEVTVSYTWDRIIFKQRSDYHIYELPIYNLRLLTEVLEAEGIYPVSSYWSNSLIFKV